MTMKESLLEIRERLERIEAFAGIGAKSVLTIDEAALFTGYRKSTLYKYAQRAAIPHYRQHSKVFFRKGELEAWLTERRVRTDGETAALAAAYAAPGGPVSQNKPKTKRQKQTAR